MFSVWELLQLVAIVFPASMQPPGLVRIAADDLFPWAGEPLGQPPQIAGLRVTATGIRDRLTASLQR